MESQAEPPREPTQSGQSDQTDSTPPHSYQTRSDIPAAYRWQLADIFASTDDWDAAFASLPSRLETLRSLRGTLNQSPNDLVQVLTLSSQLDQDCMELLAYARMHRDEDNTVSTYQAMTDRITAFYYQYAESAAFILPELARIPEHELRSWLVLQPDLADFSMVIEDSIRNRPHTLSEAEEALLSRFGPASEGINDVFGMLDHVEIDLGLFPDEKGDAIRLTQGRFAQLREHPDRQVRANAFRQIHESYGRFGQTLATLYSTRVKTDIAFSAARRFPDTLSGALFADNLPKETVTGLIQAVETGLPTLRRYYELRRRLLGYSELHLYDTYVPLVPEHSRTFGFEQACDLVRDGLKPLGPDYGQALERHLTENWIDVYETPGKTTGAYSWGTYRSHPYVLLNYSSMRNDVFTLAHEVGHSLHTYFSNRQPFVKSHYPIFLAEIASTVNENLLMRHLLSQCDPQTPEGRAEKITLLNHFLEEFRLTVFRQTMFAEFEYEAHVLGEAGQPLTADVLTSLYLGLLHKYFGTDVIIDDYMAWEWSRIPHFYNAYYVFKYATGFSAAVALSQQILSGGEAARARYLDFLSSGGSDYPLVLLQQAGVDLSTATPIEAAMAEFAFALAELETLLDQPDGCSTL